MSAVEQLVLAKQKESYHQLSRRLDIPINTLRRWIKTGKIGNKVYEQVLSERLNK